MNEKKTIACFNLVSDYEDLKLVLPKILPVLSRNVFLMQVVLNSLINYFFYFTNLFAKINF
jgi:hypothetical protein